MSVRPRVAMCSWFLRLGCAQSTRILFLCKYSGKKENFKTTGSSCHVFPSAMEVLARAGQHECGHDIVIVVDLFISFLCLLLLLAAVSSASASALASSPLPHLLPSLHLWCPLPAAPTCCTKTTPTHAPFRTPALLVQLTNARLPLSL